MDELLPGTLLGDHIEVLSRTGGTGAVRRYLAKHLEHRGHVVVHVLEVAEADANSAERELAQSADVTHPGIPERLATGQTKGGEVFSAERFPPGELLNDLLRPGHSACPELVAVQRMLSVLAVLRALHEAGIIHGNVEPSWVLLEQADSDGEHVRLLGAGVAQALRKAGVGVLHASHYLPPEVRSGKAELSVSADVYGVGAIGVAMLVGTDGLAEVNEGQGLPALLRDTPLEAFLERALSVSPEDRFESVQSFAEQLSERLTLLRKQSERAKKSTPDGFTSSLAGVVGSPTQLPSVDDDWRMLLPDAHTSKRHSTLAALEAELAFAGADESQFGDLLSRAAEDNSATKVTGPPVGMENNKKKLSGKPPLRPLREQGQTHDPVVTDPELPSVSEDVDAILDSESSELSDVLDPKLLQPSPRAAPTSPPARPAPAIRLARLDPMDHAVTNVGPAPTAPVKPLPAPQPDDSEDAELLSDEFFLDPSDVVPISDDEDAPPSAARAQLTPQRVESTAVVRRPVAEHPPPPPVAGAKSGHERPNEPDVDEDQGPPAREETTDVRRRPVPETEGRTATQGDASAAAGDTSEDIALSAGDIVESSTIEAGAETSKRKRRKKRTKGKKKRGVHDESQAPHEVTQMGKPAPLEGEQPAPDADTSIEPAVSVEPSQLIDALHADPATSVDEAVEDAAADVSSDSVTIDVEAIDAEAVESRGDADAPQQNSLAQHTDATDEVAAVSTEISEDSDVVRTLPVLGDEDASEPQQEEATEIGPPPQRSIEPTEEVIRVEHAQLKSEPIVERDDDDEGDEDASGGVAPSGDRLAADQMFLDDDEPATPAHGAKAPAARSAVPAHAPSSSDADHARPEETLIVATASRPSGLLLSAACVLLIAVFAVIWWTSRAKEKEASTATVAATPAQQEVAPAQLDNETPMPVSATDIAHLGPDDLMEEAVSVAAGAIDVAANDAADMSARSQVADASDEPQLDDVSVAGTSDPERSTDTTGETSEVAVAGQLEESDEHYQRSRQDEATPEDDENAGDDQSRRHRRHRRRTVEGDTRPQPQVQVMPDATKADPKPPTNSFLDVKVD